MRKVRSVRSRPPSNGEQALFEAGIKLGGLFHQFIGVPVAPSSAPSLARAIEKAVGLQPYVRQVRVKIDPEKGGKTGTGRFGYRYLTAEMLDVELTIVVKGVPVLAELHYRTDLRYPLMTASVPLERKRRAP